MHTEPPTPRDKLSPIASPIRKKSNTTLGSLINDSKEDEERTCLDRLEMEEEKSLMQQLHKATLRKNMNPTWTK
jgi:hypothetical protein